jgi:hypothetical protein
MEEDQGRPPGLRLSGKRAHWRASKAAVAAGYPLKSVNLTRYRDEPAVLRSQCDRLQAEMLSWDRTKSAIALTFTGTFNSLFDLYENDPESSYQKLKRSSRHPYSVYMRMMRVRIGKRLINDTDGRDLARWFVQWSTEDIVDGDKPRIAKARMAIAVLRAATTFGIACRKPGCVEFSAVIGACTFEGLKPRTVVISAEKITLARAAAHAIEHPGAALSYALQFEGMARQWDCIGEWVPLSDPRPSAVLHNGRKWIGPTWNHVDANLILRFTPGKTQTTTEAEVVIDLAACPMVMDEIAGLPPAARTGPLIMDHARGIPYTKHRYGIAWKVSAKAAGIPATTWNRDTRKSGVHGSSAVGRPYRRSQEDHGPHPGNDGHRRRLRSGRARGASANCGGSEGSPRSKMIAAHARRTRRTP